MDKYSIIIDEDFKYPKCYRVFNNETKHWIIDPITMRAVMDIETASRCLVKVSLVPILESYLNEQKIYKS